MYLVHAEWCPGTDPTAFVTDEYIDVSPWPVDITEEGFANVAHTLAIGGNLVTAIPPNTVLHVTVHDNDQNAVPCTNLGVSNLFHRNWYNSKLNT